MKVKREFVRNVMVTPGCFVRVSSTHRQGLQELTLGLVLEIQESDAVMLSLYIPSLGKEVAISEHDLSDLHTVSQVEIEERVLEETDGHFSYQDEAECLGKPVTIFYAADGMVHARVRAGDTMIARRLEDFQPQHVPSVDNYLNHQPRAA